MPNGGACATPTAPSRQHGDGRFPRRRAAGAASRRRPRRRCLVPPLLPARARPWPRGRLMDAPPPHEDVGPFLAVAAILRDLGLQRAGDPRRGHASRPAAARGFRRRHLHAAAGRRRRRGRALCAGDRHVDRAARALAAGGPARLPPYDEARLLDEAALLVDWYLPAVIGAAGPAVCARNISRSGGAAAARRRRVRPTLVLRDYHVDNLMLLPRPPGGAGAAGCSISRTRSAARPLRSRLAAGGCAARCLRPARRAMTARYLAAFPGARPRGVPALRRGPRGAAQLQDPRHLHPALAARRQARLSRAYPAALAPARGRSARPGAGAGRALARPPHAACASAACRDPRAPHDRTAATGDGAGRRARHAAAPDHRHRAEAAGRAQRAALCSIMRSTAWRSAGVERVVVNTHYKAAR